MLDLIQYPQGGAHNPCLSINIHVSLPSLVILALRQYPQGGATMPDSIIQICKSPQHSLILILKITALWIPAYAGMTVRDAGMTVMDAGMTVRDAGMTVVAFAKCDIIKCL